MFRCTHCDWYNFVLFPNFKSGKSDMDCQSELNNSHQSDPDPHQYYSGRIISNNKDCALRIAKSTVPLSRRSLERLSPVVVLPNLNLIIQDRVNQVRVPFGKVNPLTVHRPVLETVSEDASSTRRRNATRACRNTEPTTTLPILAEPKHLHHRSLLSKIPSRKQRSCPSLSTLSPERLPCSYCEKLFTCEEFAKEHEQYCERAPTFQYLRPEEESDTMNNSSRKMGFLNLLGLQTMSSTESEEVVISEEQSCESNDRSITLGAPVNLKRGRARRCQLNSFLRSNPLPITSKLGKKLALESKLGVCENPAEAVQKYEQFCVPQTNRFYVREHKQKWPTTISRKMKFKKDHYVHNFSFNRTQRLVRYMEITLGLSLRACSLLNGCRDVSVCVKKLPERDCIKYMWKKHIYNLMRTQYHTNSQGRKKLHPSCFKIFPIVEIVGLENTPEGVEFLRKKNLLPQTI